jgi:MYXO-CTERM domain-containing protein
MKQIIKTAMVGALALVATLAAERDAAACQQSQDQCATLVDPNDPTVTYHSQTTVSYATTNPNCGCSSALSLANLPPEAQVTATVFVNNAGTPTKSFCGAGINGPTTTALQNAFPGLGLSNAALAAVSAGGVIPNQNGFIVSRIVNNPDHASPAAIVTAQINFGPDGSIEVDNTHQGAVPVAACTDCAATPFTANCIAAQNALTYFDGAVPYLAACAKTDAVALLGLDQPIEDTDGGCSVPGKGSAGGLLVVFLGLGLATRKRRS